MRLIGIIFLLFLCSPVFAEDIEWGNNINEAFKKSTENGNRPILVYLTMDNCIYCKKMEGITLKDSRIISALKSLIPVKLKNELHEDQVRIFNVQGFPTTLLLRPKTNSDNKKILNIEYKSSGYLSVDELISSISSIESK